MTIEIKIAEYDIGLIAKKYEMAAYFNREYAGDALVFVKNMEIVSQSQIVNRRILDLSRIYVYPEYRRNGLGRRFLEEAIKISDKEKCDLRQVMKAPWTEMPERFEQLLRDSDFIFL